PYSVAKSRTSLCNPADATVFAGKIWSKTRITRSGSQSGTSRWRKASIASGPVTSCAIAKSTGATTISPAWMGRSIRREKISSVSVPIGFSSCRDRAPEQVIEFVIAQRTGIGPPLDLGGERPYIVLGQRQPEGRRPVGDGMAAGQAVAGHHRPLAAEARWVEDLVARWVAQDGVGVHPGLVMEGRVAGNRRVEGDLDADHAGDHPVELGEDLEPVLGDQVGTHAEQSGDHPAERHD